MLMSADQAFPRYLLEQPPSKRLKYFESYKAAHPRLVQATESLLRNIENPAGASFIFVYGPTGIGKTTMRLRTEQQLVERVLPLLSADKDRIPVVGIEAVGTESSSFNWKDYFTRGLIALKANSLPAHCSACNQWLGYLSSSEPLPENELNWQLWVTQTIGQLLVAGSDLHEQVPQTRIKEVLNLDGNHLTGGNINAFARFLEQRENSLHKWVSGQAKPQLNQLLEICYRLNTFLTDFLLIPTTELQFSELTQIVIPPAHRAKKQNRLNRQQAMLVLQAALVEFPPPSVEEVIKRLNTHRQTLISWVPDICRSISERYKNYKLNQKITETRAVLHSVIESDELPPPSLMQVARRFKISGYPYFWREHCSDLCDAISLKHSQYKKAESEKRRHEIYQEMRQIVLSLHQRGIKPTSSKVSQLLTKPGVLIERDVRAEFRKIRRELGYEK